MPTDATLDLFGRLPVGSQPVATSEAAADRLERGRTVIARRWNVLRYVASCGDLGATADEVEAAFGLGHNATSPRVTELLAMGLLERLDGKDGRRYERRATRQGGTAFVHRINALGIKATRAAA